jgi:cellulose synthase/poly-beta-1,6-N-acetylglucosamine synthase-like glycosyltransferase
VSTVLIVLSCLIALPGAGTALHLGFIASASIFYRVPRGAHPAAVHFLVLVPAHNEELVIADTLRAVCADLRVGDQVLVIADRCTDATASIARDAGALVLERGPDEEPGRAAARQAGVEYSLGLPWDAMVMIDADSIIERGFFDTCESALADGALALQARSEAAEGTRILDQAMLASFAVQGVMLPRGRDRLGLLVRLRGTGMVLRRELVSRFHFRAAASEDLWYTLDLCLEGIVPRHVENARLRSANTGTWSAAGTQRVRYEAGRMSAAKEFVKPLLRKHSAASLEAALFLLTPPFAVGAACLVVGILFAALAGASILMWAEIALFGLLVAALAVALVEARARPRTWLALAIAPWYLPWKAFVQVRALLSVRRGAESFGATPRT